MRSEMSVSKRDQQAGEASGTFSLRVVPRSRRATSRSAARSALSIVLVRPASCAAKPGCTVRQVPLRSQDAPFSQVFCGPCQLLPEPSASHDQIPHRSLEREPPPAPTDYGIPRVQGVITCCQSTALSLSYRNIRSVKPTWHLVIASH